MKRVIYLLAAVALTASCTQNEILVDTENSVPEQPSRIGFATFVNKSTRATGENSTSLNDFYPTFKVYGWKTVGNATSDVFENVAVGYYDTEADNDYIPGAEWGEDIETGWYYDNIRYWDNMATAYQFCAYTPAPAGVAIECESDGTITIGTENAPITVDDTNLMDTPAESLAYTGFATDYMTATSKEEASPVTLNFQHLQAKLNIRIKLAESITTAQDVSVQKIEVHNLGDKGYYTNALDANGKAAGVSGWTITESSSQYVPTADNVYSLNNANGNFHNHYVLEQLILPQTIDKYTGNEMPSLSEYGEACIYVEYKIGEEKFKSYSPLANIFTDGDTYSFEGGKQYTLNITVGPDPIEFEPNVKEWTTAIQDNLDME